MPQIIMIKGSNSVDGSVKRAVQSFMEKLIRDDTTPGLHIEPITGSYDKRVRTGRVDKFHRAVLVRLAGGEDATYVYAGTFGHDEAIDYAKRVKLRMNPVVGVPELEEMVAPKPDRAKQDLGAAVKEAAEEQAGSGVEAGAESGSGVGSPTESERESQAEAPTARPSAPEAGPQGESSEGEPSAAREQAPSSTGGSQPHHPILADQGHTLESLTALGIRPDIAKAALDLRTEDALLAFADRTRPTWQGYVLVSLACGQSAEQAIADLQLGSAAPDEAEDEDLAESQAQPAAADASEDETILRAMHHPAARLDFMIVDPSEEGMAEFRAALDADSFDQWRVFLHPQQRAYATRSRNGAFRLSGGAGTGKTVVLLHRARTLHQHNDQARIVLTTFNRTLAASLQSGLDVLDASIPKAEIGEAGVAVAGVDALARRILVAAGSALGEPGRDGKTSVAKVLGQRTPQVLELTKREAWQEALEATPNVPEAVTAAFMQAEYSLIVLPNRITTEAEYLKVRRPGRGMRLGRAQRRAVWQIISAYRARAAAEGSTDWHEKAMIAATYLDDQFAQGIARPADHVLVDEAQDLSPAHLRFLRALASEGKNDLFLAEDSHQRIYSPKVVLSHVGINIRGRSRRLTLNYRTTAQNLHYAVGVLAGASFTDMSGEEVSIEGYRSTRTGIAPVLRGYDSIADEYDGVADQIETWQNSAGKGELIGLLCASKYRGGRWVRELAERGIEATFVGSDQQPPDASSGRRVAVMTLHRAKGMEFSKVILTGMNDQDAFGSVQVSQSEDPDEYADELLRRRSLIYVATTRARDELVITWAGKPNAILGGV